MDIGGHAPPLLVTTSSDSLRGRLATGDGENQEAPVFRLLPFSIFGIKERQIRKMNLRFHARTVDVAGTACAHERGGAGIQDAGGVDSAGGRVAFVAGG